MYKKIFFTLLASLPSVLLAQEQARVISSTPVVQQHSIPRQVCNQVLVDVQQPKSGAGAALGAIAGGALGSTMGKGGGTAAATVAGVVAGAVVGDRMEESRASPQYRTVCTTEQVVESNTMYNVVYEYGGRQYSVMMPNDPGPFVAVQVSPVVSSRVPQQQVIVSGSPPVPIVQPVLMAPYPYGYVYPYAYPYPAVSVEYRSGYRHRH